jgi:hypothetical protein
MLTNDFLLLNMLGDPPSISFNPTNVVFPPARIDPSVEVFRVCIPFFTFLFLHIAFS